MATENTPKRRSQRSARLSRKTRSGHELASALLTLFTDDPTLTELGQQPTMTPLLALLKQDEATLASAAALRIGAARRLQGASSRRHTTAQQLFAGCGEIRRRIKVRFRGPRHEELRRSFGEGHAANAAKPETVLALAEHILRGAALHPEAMKEVRVGPPTLQRLNQLLTTLREGRPERASLRHERHQVHEDLGKTAARVQTTSAALLEQAEALLSPTRSADLQALRLLQALVRGRPR